MSKECRKKGLKINHPELVDVHHNHHHDDNESKDKINEHRLKWKKMYKVQVNGKNKFLRILHIILVLFSIFSFLFLFLN